MARVLSDKMSKPKNFLVYMTGTSTPPVLDVSDKGEGKYRIQFNILIIIVGCAGMHLSSILQIISSL